MKKFLSVIKACFGRAKKAAAWVAATLVLSGASALPVSAKGTDKEAATPGTTINPNATTETVIGGILDVVFKIAFYLGIVIAVIGVVSFILAFKDDNAESQSRGIRLAIVGTALIGIKVLIGLTGLVN